MRNAKCGMRNAKVWSFATTLTTKFRIPHSPFRIQLFTAALVESPIHHSAGSSLGGAVIAALLVGRLGKDRRHFGGHAVVIERDVGEITRVGVTLLAGERVLGEHLDPHLHRRL